MSAQKEECGKKEWRDVNVNVEEVKEIVKVEEVEEKDKVEEFEEEGLVQKVLFK